MKNRFDILIPAYRDHSNVESDRAKALFREFLDGKFSYDAISGHPGYMGYASAETLSEIMPLMIDEMLRRNDSANYLVYPMISVIDPYEEISGSVEVYKERFAKFVSLADSDLIEKICKFIDILKIEPPVPDERLDRVLAFWQALKGKAGSAGHR